MNSNDTTFITNQNGGTLQNRFSELIRDSRFFDCLVAYFAITGFNNIAHALEKTEKIRILVGISVDGKTLDIYKKSYIYSIKASKDIFRNELVSELENSEDTLFVEDSVRKFLDWVNSGKLEIRIYPSRDIHAKVYIFSFREGDRDVGRVITGSSNFTYSGLVDNLEFNVELKNRSDYDYAKQKFEELWKEGIDISEVCVSTVKENSWLREDITPHKLYLKFLYEYFKDQLDSDEDIYLDYKPQGFRDLEYQKQAVLNAKRILNEYGGVFISDVVGLGKTYIAAMLAKQLDGHNLVIAPPALIDENNLGSWNNVFADFRVQARFVSIGKLKQVKDYDRYKNVFIDEAHRFRNEDTESYEILSNICRGKRVVLITATPYNNSPIDLLNQIKLFQSPRSSTIPNLKNLERFFKGLDEDLRKIKRDTEYNAYLKQVKSNAKKIREKVLKYLMVRRTRSEIVKYFGQDLQKQGLKFPVVDAPTPLFYQLNEEEDRIFSDTLQLITKKFRYARYKPLTYLKDKTINTTQSNQSQINLVGFMKVILVKRLESSFEAFRRSLNRFIKSYETFIDEYNKGNVYISKSYKNKIYELLREDRINELQALLDEKRDDIDKYSSDSFDKNFLHDLESDLEILKNIEQLWQRIKRDPKIEYLKNILNKDENLKDKKVVIFTEAEETAEYVSEEINKQSISALCFTGSSNVSLKKLVIDNFDANAENKRDEYKILVATDTLSEGVNLHRSNVVINYDIPWNPTRVIQRVGRVNRVNTKFDRIFIYNFFPAKQANDQIKLKETAESKLSAFLELLGGDAALLTENEPVGSHELFDKLSSSSFVQGEEQEESELKYLTYIKNIKIQQEKLFEEIKRIPKKARSAKVSIENLNGNSLLTYFRKGPIQKFYIASSNSSAAKEVSFLEAVKILESDESTQKQSLNNIFFDLLNKNKEAFRFSLDIEEEISLKHSSARNMDIKILKNLKYFRQQNQNNLNDDEEKIISTLISAAERGDLTKRTQKKLYSVFGKYSSNKDKLFEEVKKLADVDRLRDLDDLDPKRRDEKEEIILSMYLL